MSQCASPRELVSTVGSGPFQRRDSGGLGRMQRLRGLDASQAILTHVGHGHPLSDTV